MSGSFLLNLSEIVSIFQPFHDNTKSKIKLHTKAFELHLITINDSKKHFSIWKFFLLIILWVKNMQNIVKLQNK